MVPRLLPCGVLINTLVDLIKLAGESPSFTMYTYYTNKGQLAVDFQVLSEKENTPGPFAVNGRGNQ